MAIAPAIGSSFELSPFRAIELFFPPTHSFIATPGHVAKIWEFASAGEPTWTCVQGVLSCPSVRWGGLPGRASGEVLATPVLEVAQS